jgi:diguanylate cyclase (GGDEF)-like protein
LAAQEYPRAEAVATMQGMAAAADSAYDVLGPPLNALLPESARFGFEHGLAVYATALSAYAIADAHDARAQAIALNFNDWDGAADAIGARAENALTVGNYARCEQMAQLLAQLAQDTHSRRLRMHAEAYLGILDRRHGNLDAAADHQHNALDLARELGDDVAMGRTLAHLGTIYRDQGDFARALDMQLQAMVLGEQTDDRIELIYRNLALLYRELGDDTESKRYFDRAIAAAERNGDPAHYATVYGSYSSFLNDTRDHAGALRAASEVLALDQVLRDRPASAFEQLEIGRALIGLKRLDEAVAPLDAALAGGRAINQREIISRALLAQAEVALGRGDRVHARTLLDQAIEGVDSRRSKPQLAQAYALREQVAAADGDTATALRYAHEYATLREDLLGTATNRRLTALETRHARADSEQKLALANEANALQAARLEQQRMQRMFGGVAITGLLLLLAVFVWRWLDTRRLNQALNLRNRQIERQSAALTDANQRLERQAGELYQAAITDPLTGVYNRGYLLRQLDARVTECSREGHELAVLLIDFDHFKQLNDARGHLFGDRVLVGGVQTIRQWLEPGDLIGRYGGEEFVVALTGRDLAGARALAERLRARVADTLAAFAPELHAVATISIGIALLSQLDEPVRLEDIIEAADRAVYMAKEHGRNRVMNYVVEVDKTRA